MKTKKLFLAVSLASLSIIANAQIKVIAGGNVGIGQSNPSTAKCEILNTSGGYTFRAGMGSSSPNLDIWQASSGGSGARTSLLFSYGAFEIYDAQNSASRLWVNSSDGKVGIGTTSPGGNLHVVGVTRLSSGSAVWDLTPTATTNYPLAIIDRVNSIRRGLFLTNGDVFLGGSISTDAGANASVSVVSGSVGIGTTSPSYKLDVSGTTRCTNGVWVSSDKRYKKNIKGIDNALSKIMKLNGKSYEYNKEEFKTLAFNDGSSIGFIAQELKEVLPEVVSVDNNGFYSINYSAIIPVLTEAIKEQNTKIISLETQLSYCCTNKQAGNNTTVGNIGSGSSTQANGQTINAHLLQNNPNPFNQQTNIGYYLPIETQAASLMIFDMQGKLIKTIAVTNFGNALLTLNANELSAGMFIYSLIADGKEVDNKRMILTE